MLFQPTNVTPSTRGSLGDWTVDVSTGELTVSWMVNGNSPMVGFSITFYKNDANSTLVYQTGRRTDNCPFYGVDSEGNPQFFSYTFSTVNSTFENGNEYKFIIRQYYGPSSSDYVALSSASVFLTRDAPILMMDPYQSHIYGRSSEFSASYFQQQGDALNWVQWILVNVGTVEEGNTVVYDTGKIYGTAELRFKYDGFMRNNAYAVKCRIQTENGVEVETPWHQLVVTYGVDSVSGTVSATKDCNKSAALVSWPDFALSYIPGTATGDYTLRDGNILLGSNASVVWNHVNNGPMSFDPDWTLITKFVLQGETGIFLSLVQSNGNIDIGYNSSTATLTIYKGGSALYSKSTVATNAEITLILTHNKVYLRVGIPAGGLFPLSNLYPEETLYPGGQSYTGYTYSANVSYSQVAITTMSVHGYVKFNYVQVIEGDPSATVITEAWTDGTYVPDAGDGVYFCATFHGNVNGGVLEDYDEDGLIAIYREDGTTGELLHIADISADKNHVWDYGAASQQGPYTYEVLFSSISKFLTDAILSPAISPCFWDWSLIEAKLRDGTKTEYEVLREFRFGKNLTSGSISNNNSPYIAANFTRYPTVQSSPVNWKSGSLTSLIGSIDFSDGMNTYKDTIKLRDDIYALSTTQNTLFLKNRKGDFIMIRISGPITMETMDETREQAQNVSLPWVECGSTEGLSLTIQPGDKLYV